MNLPFDVTTAKQMWIINSDKSRIIKTGKWACHNLVGLLKGAGLNTVMTAACRDTGREADRSWFVLANGAIRRRTEVK